MTDRGDVLQRLAEYILGVQRPHPTRVCVDGHSAAGKSTLTTELEVLIRAAGRSCVRVEIDDFHPEDYLHHPARFGGVEHYLRDGYAWDVVIRDVLVPAGPNGDRRVRRRYWDSFHDRVHEPGWTVLGQDTVLLIDGVFSQLPWLRTHWDVTVWLDVDFETILKRAVVRDLAWGGGTEEGVRQGYEERWLPRHRHYADTYRPAEAAHVVIDNRRPESPVINKLVELRHP